MRETRSCYFELVSGKDNILLYQKLENFAMGIFKFDGFNVPFKLLSNISKYDFML